MHSTTGFLLPPFIQDYGPGPAEFDPEPENEDAFDAVMRDIMADVDAGTWVEGEPVAELTGGG